jgi:hypothetical protein
MAPSPHSPLVFTAPRADRYAFAFAYRAWRFTQALGRLS